MVSLNRVLGVLKRGSVEVRAETANGSEIALGLDDFKDIGQVVNDALERAGKGGYVIVENGKYLKSEGNPLETTITTQAEGQRIDFRGSDIEMADGTSNSRMVSLEHDSAAISNGNLRGNRNNNGSIQDVVRCENIAEPSLFDIEVSGAPTGIFFDNTENGQVTTSGTTEANQDVDDALVLRQTEDTSVIDAKTSGFNNDGIRLENCFAVVTRALGIVPESGLSASNGVHVLGSRDCIVGGTIDADGELDKGVVDEGFDVGGAEEEFSTANVFNMAITGVNDIGFHIRDAEKERVRGLVDGTKPVGRTTQAFLVDAPNGLADPQHDINLSGITLTRITDTAESGPNVGMRLSGHFSKISDVSDITAGGQSTVNFQFGQAVNNPAANIGSGTQVAQQITSNRATTNPSGQVTIDWSDSYHFEDKPILSVSIEQAGQWHVDSYGTDGSGRFTDATIQVTDSSGTAVGNNVQVNAKVLGV